MFNPSTAQVYADPRNALAPILAAQNMMRGPSGVGSNALTNASFASTSNALAGSAAGGDPYAAAFDLPGQAGSAEDALKLAGQQMGLNETSQKAALQDYLSNGGLNLDPAVRAWCADFVNATLRQVGVKGTGSGMARSFENFGTAVNEPQPGDLAVFWRESPSSGKGHVGFFQGYDDAGNVLVLGGNQSDSVSVAPYSPDRLLSFRRY